MARLRVSALRLDTGAGRDSEQGYSELQLGTGSHEFARKDVTFVVAGHARALGCFYGVTVKSPFTGAVSNSPAVQSVLVPGA